MVSLTELSWIKFIKLMIKSGGEINMLNDLITIGVNEEFD